ncbi:MAG TPA: hypothetical protein VK824_12235 [Planctomycetota bacterium]|nr:hypothetical protein [Planctomycetota bacterium]
MTLARLDRVLVPVLLLPVAAAAALGLLEIWVTTDSALLAHLLKSCLALALASGFVLSATRLGASGARRED